MALRLQFKALRKSDRFAWFELRLAGVSIVLSTHSLSLSCVQGEPAMNQKKLAETQGLVMDVQAMAQADDIRASEDVGIYGFLREKKYVKDKDLELTSYPRTLPFPEPYQVASAVTGVPWNITNYACILQLQGCNLSCDYCFCGKTKPKTVSALDVLENYRSEYVDKCDRCPTPVFRISGGEPFLQQEFLSAIISTMCTTDLSGDCFHGSRGLYFWVDTNLTIAPSDELLDILSGENIGVCGCFKPELPGPLFKAQYTNASALINAGVDTYFYYPCSLTETEKNEIESHKWAYLWDDYAERWRAEFTHHLNLGSSILGKFYPCRVHPIKIRYDYGTVGGSQKWNEISAIKQTSLFAVIEDYIYDNLGGMYHWLPDYQVDIVKGARA